MIALLIEEQITKDKARVGAIHFKPEMLNEATASKAIMVENKLADPELIKGKTAQLFVNPITKEQWYEYFDRPLTQEEISTDILTKLDEISVKLTELINIQKV